MSVTTVLTQLAVVLANVNPTPQPVPVRIVSTPREAINISDFPMIVCAFGQGIDNEIGELAGGGFIYHRWTAVIYVFVASTITPLPEVYSRCEPWAAAMATALYGDLTLNGSCTFIGNDEHLFKYQHAPIDWTGDKKELYWVLKFELPIEEHMEVTLAA
ncbi:MAG: hypothetical protein C0391_03910 [Anaerolinea sp.]|nr:hypothetical protein [Anaerolinea sp.]